MGGALGYQGLSSRKLTDTLEGQGYGGLLTAGLLPGHIESGKEVLSPTAPWYDHFLNTQHQMNTNLAGLTGALATSPAGRKTLGGLVKSVPKMGLLAATQMIEPAYQARFAQRARQGGWENQYYNQLGGEIDKIVDPDASPGVQAARAAGMGSTFVLPWNWGRLVKLFGGGTGAIGDAAAEAYGHLTDMDYLHRGLARDAYEKYKAGKQSYEDYLGTVQRLGQATASHGRAEGPFDAAWSAWGPAINPLAWGASQFLTKSDWAQDQRAGRWTKDMTKPRIGGLNGTAAVARRNM